MRVCCKRLEGLQAVPSAGYSNNSAFFSEHYVRPDRRELPNGADPVLAWGFLENILAMGLRSLVTLVVYGIGTEVLHILEYQRHTSERGFRTRVQP